MKDADDLIAELPALRQAPAIDPYTGPAILEPEAAGVLFHEAVGHRLEGDRQDNDAEGKTFRGRSASECCRRSSPSSTTRRWPRSAASRSTATTATTTRACRGSGSPLVEKGVLRNFLLSRHPVDGFLHSNGHGRAQVNRRPVARMANLIVNSTRTGERRAS